ncbi:hypothetical protein A2U01_0113067, partial [Trifolium medium]|nr:hypothetical protein [Trifolium medium]
IMTAAARTNAQIVEALTTLTNIVARVIAVVRGQK